MQFLTVRDFRASSKKIWTQLAAEGKMVITNNGKPAALMLDVSSADLEKVLLLLRQMESMHLLQELRAEAKERGFLSDAEIATEIQAARAALKRGGKAKK